MRFRVNFNEGDAVFEIVYVLSETRDDSEWLIELLKSSNNQYSILIIAISKELPEYLIDETNFRFIWIKSRSKFQIFSMVYLMKKLMRGKKISLIHSHGFIAAILASFLKILTPEVILVVSRHHGILHTITKNWLASKIDQFISRFAEHTIVYSMAMKQALMKIEGIAESKIHVMPLGISSKNVKFHLKDSISLARRELGLNEGDFVIGTNSRDVEWKGLRYVIDAAADLAESFERVSIIMINVNPDSYSVSYALNKTNAYTVVSHLKVRSLQTFYSSIDVFCHVPISRFAEPAGLVYLEALAFGLPTIYTQSGLMNELCAASNWIKVDYLSKSEILSALRQLMQQKNKNPRNFSTSHSLVNGRVPERYIVENSVKEQLEFYKKFK